MEVAVLGSPSLIVLMVSVDVKQNCTELQSLELRSCVKVEVAVLGSSPSLIVIIIIDNFCVALFSSVHKLTALYNISNIF